MNVPFVPAWTLRDRLFSLIAYHDVELAEAFLNRCHDTDSVAELNQFFHLTLARLNVDTCGVRATLMDHDDPTTWLKRFNQNVMPLLLKERFPNDTRKNCTSLYAL